MLVCKRDARIAAAKDKSENGAEIVVVAVGGGSMDISAIGVQPIPILLKFNYRCHLEYRFRPGL